MNLKDDFKFVGEVRKSCGLDIYHTSPKVEEFNPSGNDSSGYYIAYDHTVAFEDDPRNETIWHEMCHAHQRLHISTPAAYEYRSKTSYQERWYEIEATMIAELCSLKNKYPSLDIKHGDHKRIIDPLFGKYSRSLRLRLNKAKEVSNV